MKPPHRKILSSRLIRFRVCRGLPERVVAENRAGNHSSLLHSVFLQSIDRTNAHPGLREGYASTEIGFVTFEVQAFRLNQGNVYSSIGKDRGLLPDEESQLILEAYGVSQAAVMPVSC